jgi:two-component system, chemotaxis family, CheB/CheR fusion protein
VIEQQETNSEELRSANEEIQSSTEELQSINEELETAKEELQSSNEELATVNDELANRAQELEQANSDLTNLISSMDIPIVIVGSNLHVRRFTPQAAKLLKLIDTDVGRPLSDINSGIAVPNLNERVGEVIDKVKSVQCDAADAEGRWYSVWIHPYKTSDHRVSGAVIAFIDIDRLKRSLDETRRARAYAEAIISAIRNPLLVLDKHLRVVSASRAYLDVFQVSEKETLESLVYRLGNGQWAIPLLRAKLEAAVEDGTEFIRFPVTHDFENIGEQTVNVSGRRIPTGTLSEPMVLMQIEDVSEPGREH